MSGIPFGKYLLFERIAAGGMAEIYRAKYLAAAGVTKPVVIKKILPHYAGNRNFVAMFVNEAKIAAGLSHGNIAQIFDFGEIDGEFFLTMEFVHGQTVSKMMKRAREKGLLVPIPFAVFIALEMCKGLHYAHTRVDDAQRPINIVHRDVSPQNVILSYEGQVKLVDFGIAKARLASDQEKTQAGALKGKYVYFSPEQARAKELDGRTDVYAAGVVLYEMLTGRLPFEGKMMDVLARIVRGDFERPGRVNPEIDPALEAIILKAMAVHRDHRYASALEMQEALGAYLASGHPRFTQATLAQLMSFIFRDELAAEGREVILPKSFLEQVEGWKRTGIPGAEHGEMVTNAEGNPGGSESPTMAIRAVKAPVPLSQQPWFRPAVAGGVFLLAALGAAGLVVVLGRPPVLSLEVQSTPEGVALFVDGVDTGQVTPAVLHELAPGPHRIELRSDRTEPWAGDMTGEADQNLRVVATLKVRAEAALTNPGTRPAGTVETAQGEFKVAASQLLFPIPRARSARLDLGPGSWEVSVSGEVRLSDRSVMPGCFVVFERPAGSGDSGPTFATITSRDSLTVTGATALRAFFLDDALGDDSGAIELTARGPGGVMRSARAEPKLHAVWPTSQGVRLAAPGAPRRALLELQSDARIGTRRIDQIAFATSTQAGRAPNGAPFVGTMSSGQKLELDGLGSVLLVVPTDDATAAVGQASGSFRAKR